MQKTVGLVIFSVLAILLAVSCSPGLEPAKSGARVSVSLDSFIPPTGTSSGRAVAPDYGYLYIRTIGGPLGDTGPCYGPFRLSTGSTFTTTAIPAGSYAGIGILYATEPLEDRTASYNNVNYTFIEIMLLPDSSFLDFTEGSGFTPSGFDTMIDGYASGFLLEGVTVYQGRDNVLSARLEPIMGTPTASNSTMGSFLTDTGTIVRRFYEFDISDPAYFPSGVSTCNLYATEGFFTRAILFDRFGVPVCELIDSIPQTFPARYETLYLYIEGPGTSELNYDFSGGP